MTPVDVPQIVIEVPVEIIHPAGPKKSQYEIEKAKRRDALIKELKSKIEELTNKIEILILLKNTTGKIPKNIIFKFEPESGGVIGIDNNHSSGNLISKKNNAKNKEVFIKMKWESFLITNKANTLRGDKYNVSEGDIKAKELFGAYYLGDYFGDFFKDNIYKGSIVYMVSDGMFLKITILNSKMY